MMRTFYLRIAMLLSVLMAATVVSRAQSQEAPTQAEALPEMPAKIYDKVAPVVAKIIADRGQKFGSGAVVGISSQGRALILTACHVVTSNFDEQDPNIRLEFYKDVKVKIGLDSVFVPAGVLTAFIDRANDLALVVTRHRVRHTKVIKYNRSEGVKPAQVIAAAGFFDKSHQLNLPVGRITRLEDSTNFFVSSAEIQEGYSGGPLIDKHGRMIGVNIEMSEGESYARRMNLVLSIVEGWLQSLEKKVKLTKVWEREKYTSFPQRLIKNPIFIVPEVATTVTGIYFFILKPDRSIFGEPPDPTEIR